MTRRGGRKRALNRERYDNGRTRPIKDEGPTPGMVREIIYGALRKATDPLLRSVIGRLTVEKFLTEHECAAGMRFAELAARYDSLKGFPRRFAKSPDYMGGYGASLREEPTEELIEQVSDRYNSAVRAMGTCSAAVVDVAVYDVEPSGHVRKQAVKWGLEQLARFFGLTEPANRNMEKGK